MNICAKTLAVSINGLRQQQQQIAALNNSFHGNWINSTKWCSVVDDLGLSLGGCRLATSLCYLALSLVSPEKYIPLNRNAIGTAC